jgi:hypothetical protein
MNKVLASLLLVAACGGTSPTANAPHNEAAHPTTVGPAPSITWSTEDEVGNFETKGLPAVSFDGSRVLIADVQHGAGMSPPNLTLREIDRSDHAAGHQDVLPWDPSGPDDAKPEPGAVDAANKFLASSNEELGWTAMTGIQPDEISDPDGKNPDQWHAVAGAVEIVFSNEQRLTVKDGGKVVFDKDEPAWLAPPNHNGDGPCGNPAYLDQAYVDGAHRLALVVIAYHGTDSCWEPSPEMHVVTW